MLRALFSILVLFLLACTQTPRQEAKTSAPVKTYALKGEIMALDGSTQVVTVKHEKIGDWMEAMTMGFPVRDKGEFEKLKPGQKVQGKVNVQGDDYWLSDVVTQP